MRIAVYNENTSEWKTLQSHLEKCGQDMQRTMRTDFYNDYGDFFHTIAAGRHDILLVAQDGTFSLEVMEAIKSVAPRTPVIWFSDLDFAIRSYDYGVVWFGRKPVELAKLKKAFARACKNEL